MIQRVCLKSQQTVGTGVCFPGGVGGRTGLCVCVWEGVDRTRKGCCSTVFTRVPAGRLCARRRLFFPHCRPLPTNANCLLICHSCPGKCNSDPPPGYIHPSSQSPNSLPALKPLTPTVPRPAPRVVNSSIVYEFNARV